MNDTLILTKFGENYGLYCLQYLYFIILSLMKILNESSK